MTKVDTIHVGCTKDNKTVFSYFYPNFTAIFGYSSSNVVPFHLFSVARRLSGLKKLKNHLKFAMEYYSFVLFIMRVFYEVSLKVRKD